MNKEYNKYKNNWIKKTFSNPLGIVCGILVIIVVVVYDHTYDNKYGQPIAEIQKQIDWLNEKYTPIHELEDRVDFNHHIIGDHYKECYREVNDGGLQPIDCQTALKEFLAERKIEYIKNERTKTNEN